MSRLLLDAYPLTWPLEQPRTPTYQRKNGKFKLSFGRARDELLRDLKLLGAKEVVLSTNVRTRPDGLPYATEREPEDPGAAVYFHRKNVPFVIACDTYRSVLDNVRALGATVNALRTIERHGSSQMLEKAFTGFAALPPGPTDAKVEPWWRTLETHPDARIDEIKAARERLALKHHPDRGGDPQRMAAINAAYDAGMAARGAR